MLVLEIMIVYVYFLKKTTKHTHTHTHTHTQYVPLNLPFFMESRYPGNSELCEDKEDKRFVVGGNHKAE